MADPDARPGGVEAERLRSAYSRWAASLVDDARREGRAARADEFTPWAAFQAGAALSAGASATRLRALEAERAQAIRTLDAEGVELMQDGDPMTLGDRIASNHAALCERARALEVEREDAEVTALRWCVHGLPRDFKAMREEVRAELLLFALYLYARAQTNAVASAKAELDRYRTALEEISAPITAMQRRAASLPAPDRICGSQGVDAEGRCVRCGLEPVEGEECPPGFLAQPAQPWRYPVLSAEEAAKQSTAKHPTGTPCAPSRHPQPVAHEYGSDANHEVLSYLEAKLQIAEDANIGRVTVGVDILRDALARLRSTEPGGEHG